jgi:hypothetical protein
VLRCELSRSHDPVWLNTEGSEPCTSCRPACSLNVAITEVFIALWSVINDQFWVGSRLKLKLSCGWQSVGQSVLVTGSHLEPTTRFLFSVWRLRVSWCVAPSLTRGWVCNLLVQLLLGSKSRRTHELISISHLRLPQPGGPSSRIYIPQEQGSPVIPPGREVF